MTTDHLYSLIKRKESMLCVGLDSDLTLIPQHLLSQEDPIFEFNKQKQQFFKICPVSHLTDNVGGPNNLPKKAYTWADKFYIG